MNRIEQIQARLAAATEEFEAPWTAVEGEDGYWDIHTDDLRALLDVAKAAREVWESVPATYDAGDPLVQRHARVLNALRDALDRLDVA